MSAVPGWSCRQAVENKSWNDDDDDFDDDLFFLRGGGCIPQYLSAIGMTSMTNPVKTLVID